MHDASRHPACVNRTVCPASLAETRPTPPVILQCRCRVRRQHRGAHLWRCGRRPAARHLRGAHAAWGLQPRVLLRRPPRLFGGAGSGDWQGCAEGGVLAGGRMHAGSACYALRLPAHPPARMFRPATRPHPCPPPAGARVLPRALEVRERHRGQPGAARAVHVAVLFPGDGGWAAARAFRARLLGDVSKIFTARSFRGAYVEAVSAPFLVRAACSAAPWW